MTDSLAVGIDLRRTPTAEGGRREPILDRPDVPFRYRPNWGLPSMRPPEQTGAPVFGLSADRATPGGPAVRAVIVPLSPESIPHWAAAEASPGAVLPMYEGSRVVGHGIVRWTRPVRLPLDPERSATLRGWLDQDRPSPRMIHAVDDPAWLPPGSRAEVWSDQHGAPRPTGLVRLLIRRPGGVFCLPREDGRLDLPTAAVPTDDPDGCRTAEALAGDVLGSGDPLHRPVGYVRNLVPDPPADYPWPAPMAHFTIWTTSGTPADGSLGGWLPDGPGSPLSGRHWFPLLSALD